MKEMARNVDGFGINDMISNVKEMVSQANQHLASTIQQALECRCQKYSRAVAVAVYQRGKGACTGRQAKTSQRTGVMCSCSQRLTTALSTICSQSAGDHHSGCKCTVPYSTALQ